ncbi:MAG: HNH endonuclease [Sphingomonas sp.]|nr:HNH endonuclease [Sphingomonas sp.]
MPSKLNAPAPAKLKAMPKRADGFYQSAAWRDLVRDIKAQRGNFCEDCGADGKTRRLFGDHVIEVKDGGALLDPENIRLRCSPCHGRKTARVRADRAVRAGR